MESLAGIIEQEAQQSRERRVFGLVTALVTAIYEDGNYEVTYLTMDEQTSTPARVMMPMAGSRRGTYFLPEVGDEVVVGFEVGDTSLPIILGAVWNEEAQPPEQANPSPDNNIRTIVSRSGHEVTFDDTPGMEKVTIKTKGGHQIVLDDTPPGKVTLQSAGGGELEILDAAGSLSIKAPLRLTLEAPLISLAASAGMQIQAPAGIQLTTTGNPAASAVVIDGRPFGLHIHFLVPPAVTGPVAP